jgi:hypothetical protein
MTFTVNSAATTLSCYIGMIADTVVVSTFYADATTLIVGLQAASAFIPLHPQQDLARCQRYYEIGTITNALLPIAANGAGAGGDSIQFNQRFQVTKRIAPTMTNAFFGTTSLIGNPTGTNGSVIDTANWTTAGTNSIGISDFTINSGRSATQTTYNLVVMNFNWTASADL